VPRRDTGLDRRRQIARKLGLTERPDIPGQYEGPCPECGRDGFSIAHPDRSGLLHIWNCGGRQRRHPAEVIRATMLRGGIPASWLGSYGLDPKLGHDPIAAATLREAVDLILGWPGLDSSQMRIMLAEARGDKFPDSYSEFARFAQDKLGIGRRNSYNLAELHCRSSSVPHPGGRSADAES
jgi:hypothetical protein